MVARRQDNDRRVPVRMGRFSPLWDFPSPLDADDIGCEIHVHLLAGDEVQAACVFDDLAAALQLEAPEEQEVCRASPVANDVSFTQAAAR